MAIASIISSLPHPEEPALAGISKDEASWFETRDDALLTVGRGGCPIVIASQRVGANGSRERAPDDRLSEAIQALEARMDCFVAEFIIGPAEGGTRWLLAMTRKAPASRRPAGSIRALGF